MPSIEPASDMSAVVVATPTGASLNASRPAPVQITKLDTAIGPPPNAVRDRLTQAPPAPLDRIQFLRDHLYQSVVAAGAGTPKDVPPTRAAELLVKGAEALLAYGAASVSACATHAVLSGPAVERIMASPIREVVFSDSIPLSEEARKCRKIRALPVAPLLARAVQSIHEETSGSILFA